MEGVNEMKGRLFVESTSKCKASSVSQKSNKKLCLDHNEGGQEWLIISKKVVRADYIGLEGCGKHLSFE